MPTEPRYSLAAEDGDGRIHRIADEELASKSYIVSIALVIGRECAKVARNEECLPCPPTTIITKSSFVGIIGIRAFSSKLE